MFDSKFAKLLEYLELFEINIFSINQERTLILMCIFVIRNASNVRAYPLRPVLFLGS